MTHALLLARIPTLLLLAAFGWVLTKVNVAHAGRADAIDGGIYLAASLRWLRAVEGHWPDVPVRRKSTA